MIAPHELKNKTFSRAVRGYNAAEVDEYFDFLIDKYTEVYKALTEAEQKFDEIKAKYDELSHEEETIRSAILKAQKLGESIVQKARDDAAGKENDLKARCDAIVEEARAKVRVEKNKIEEMRRIASEFQSKLYREYLEHVGLIQAMDLDPDLDGNSVVVKPAEADLKSAEETVLKGSGPDVITASSNE